MQIFHCFVLSLWKALFVIFLCAPCLTAKQLQRKNFRDSKHGCTDLTVGLFINDDHYGWLDVIYLSVRLSIYLAIYLPVRLPVYLSACLPAYLSICLFLPPSIYLSLPPYLPPFIYLSVHPSARSSLRPSLSLSLEWNVSVCLGITLIFACINHNFYIQPHSDTGFPTHASFPYPYNYAKTNSSDTSALPHSPVQAASLYHISVSL